MSRTRESTFIGQQKQSNVLVDAAARIKATFAAPSKLQNTLPPLASNDLLCVPLVPRKVFKVQRWGAKFFHEIPNQVLIEAIDFVSFDVAHSAPMQKKNA